MNISLDVHLEISSLPCSGPSLPTSSRCVCVNGGALHEGVRVIDSPSPSHRDSMVHRSMLHGFISRSDEADRAVVALP